MRVDRGYTVHNAQCLHKGLYTMTRMVADFVHGAESAALAAYAFMRTYDLGALVALACGVAVAWVIASNQGGKK